MTVARYHYYPVCTPIVIIIIIRIIIHITVGTIAMFPIPDSRFPIPDFKFQIPDSRFPISYLPKQNFRFFE